MKFIAASIATLALISSAQAADLPIHKPAPAPVAATACLEKNGLATDVFGFNTGSDVNDVGALSGSLTYGGSFGARNGSADGHLATAQLSYGAFPCVKIGPYLFAGAANSKAYGFNALHGSQYGGGIEVKYKFLGRDTHGVGATFDLALQGAALSGGLYGPPGLRSDSSWDAVYSLFLDKELIAGKLYGALNLGMDSNWTDMPQLFKSGYARASTLRIGASLAYQIIDGVFISAELDHFRRYDAVFFGDELGYATYAGPGIYWQATKDLALSAAWDIQLSGKAKGVPGNLDLSDFSQHIVKAKLAYGF